MKTDYYEYIEDYLEDRLSDLEREAFEAAMGENEDLKLTTENYPEIIEALEAVIQEEARISIARVREGKVHTKWEYSLEELLWKMRRYSKYAAFVLVLLAAYPVFKSSQKSSPDQVYASYYSVFPNLESGTRSIDLSDFELRRSNLHELFIRKEYDQFILGIQDFPKDYPKRNNDLFYLGIAYLEESRWEEAASEFEGVSASHSIYSDHARWYQGLSLLKSGHCSDARAIFFELSQAGYEKEESCEKIVRKLRCPAG